MGIQSRKGDTGEEKEEGKEKWVALTALREVGYRVLILYSLSMQITTITGNAWALAPANCHGNNKRGLPLSRETN